jgi:hypothetical protein
MSEVQLDDSDFPVSRWDGWRRGALTKEHRKQRMF